MALDGQRGLSTFVVQEIRIALQNIDRLTTSLMLVKANAAARRQPSEHDPGQVVRIHFVDHVALATLKFVQDDVWPFV